VVKGVRKREISADDLAFAYILMGKQIVREKREKEAAEKAKREQARRRREGAR
jgi:hypothetical protein